jgi:hypothetical protein
MSAHCNFGGGIGWNGRDSTIESIAKYIVQHAQGHPPFEALLTPKAREFSSRWGQWSFHKLDLHDYQLMDQLMDAMQADLPRAIDNWREDWRWLFYEEFPQFRVALKKRIAQLQSSKFVVTAHGRLTLPLSKAGSYLCPVCGRSWGGRPPYGDDGDPSGETCPQCLTHFGRDDVPGTDQTPDERIVELRHLWFAKIGWSTEVCREVEQALGISTDRGTPPC